MAQKLQQQLREVGSNLENPPNSKDAVIKFLKQASSCLSELDQSPSKSILESMQSFLNAIVKPELLKHQDREVKLFVATCVCEIMRITAPEAPYNDDVLKDIFHLIVSTFNGLSDTTGPSFGRRVVILETLARYRSCVVMLDLECDDLINQMFKTFFTVSSDEHPENVLTSMQTIMVLLLEESEDVPEDLLLVLLSVLGQNKKDVANAARRLAMNVIQHCAEKLEPGIKQFLVSSMSGDSKPLKCQIDHHEVIYNVYNCAPQILSGIVPYLTGELLTDQLDIRLKAVGSVGDLFALPQSSISETFQPIFLEFLKRLTDRVVEVRMSVLEHVKLCLLSNPFRVEAPQIIAALCDRLLDYDENVRKQVVSVISDVACHALNSVPVDNLKLVAERLRDKSLLVKKYTMERLAGTYRIYCLKCADGSIKSDEYDWIPGKILRCFYDKDFRSDAIEPILCVSLFPTEFSVREKIGKWVRVFSGFDKVEVKALEKILEQKQRLQQEMLRYLSLRQMYQDGDSPDLHRKAMFCFRIMSRYFNDPTKAEEDFQIFDQLKDSKIWKILTGLLDPNTSAFEACTSRDDLLAILGEKHPLYDFLSTLSMKCSYILFSKEHVKEILLEAEKQKSVGSTQFLLSCMSILVILARFSPSLLGGIEEDLVRLLEEDNETIKEGVLHVLAKAGGTIREQLGVSSSSLDLLLERICLEGSRRQAKYAVHALSAITKDDGLMSLSVLYKRLVDTLEEKTHLAAVLQSLGCIAQTAMPVFETRENEIDVFIKKNILECSQRERDNAKQCWDDRSEHCSLKIFGIKTLVKSFLPAKDAHLRLGIDDLIGMLRNILAFGELTKEIESSPIDKAHFRLAAAKAVLRLSKHWDHKIPLDVFYLTLKTSEVSFPQVRKLFLKKVHQYLKDRLLDPKYACAFLVDIGTRQPDSEEDCHNLCDIIQMCQQGKARQLLLQADSNTSVVYPEYILPFLVHALAHHPLCPNVDECKDVKAFEPLYRKLHIFLSTLVHGEEVAKSEATINQEENIATIISIFRSIKHSQDNADISKSKNSYAICDLGLSIIKNLAPKGGNLQGVNTPVSLPAVLYKSHEKKEEDDPLVSEGLTWLADETVLAHFESLKLEANGNVPLELLEDDILKESETDGNEMPLGKMIKRLRAKGAKTKKVGKNEPLPSGPKNDYDVDILKMVREINLDDTGLLRKFESSNGTKTDGKHQKRKKLVSESANVPVPKRRRSSSAHGAHKFSLPNSSPKGSRPSRENLMFEGIASFDSMETDEELHIDSEVKQNSLQGNVTNPTESDLLASCFRKNSSLSTKQRSKCFDKGINAACEFQETNDYASKKPPKSAETDSMHATSNVKMGSVKKRKRRSVAGLAKCTSKEGGIDTMDLIDCRIKVWWPMDKQFYGGVVKSFDHQKRKHVVLYDDGDVEVLRLDKERWELVDNGRKPMKQSNSSKSLPAKGVSHEARKKFLGGLRQRRKSITKSPQSKFGGKRTPRKKLKPGQKALSKKKSSSEFSEIESEESPDISQLEPTAKFRVYGSDSEGEQVETVDKSIAGGEETEKDDKSVFEGKQAKDFENGSSEGEEFQKEAESDAGRIELAAGYSHDAQGSDKEETCPSEKEQQPDLTRDDSVEEADKVQNSDFSGNQSDDTENHPTDPDGYNERTSPAHGSQDAEISDDEPLGVWKRRVGKSVEGK